MMRAFKKSIATFKENLESLTVEDYAKRISYLFGRVSDAKAVMQHAHNIRRHAAKLFNCKPSEILFSECLKMAWEALRALKDAAAC